MMNLLSVRYWKLWKSVLQLLIVIILVLIIYQYIAHDWNRLNYSELAYRIAGSYPQNNPSIDINTSHAPRTDIIDLRVIIITYNRPWSLQRLLTSLNEAEYINDRVVIEVWIDRSKYGTIDDKTYQVATHFKFDKGNINVMNHTDHVGLYGQWMGLWPHREDVKEIAVIFEDDATVSPFFYRYLKVVHAKYDSSPTINSFALQCSPIHNGGSGPLHAPDDNIVFIYPILGTCGFSPNKINWLNFLKWYRTASKDKSFIPLVPGMQPSIWYMKHVTDRRTQSMWEMWHIYYTWRHNERTLYPNLLKCDGMSIDWKEVGLHFKANIKITDRLISYWDKRLDNLPNFPVELDLHGKVRN